MYAHIGIYIYMYVCVLTDLHIYIKCADLGELYGGVMG